MGIIFNALGAGAFIASAPQSFLNGLSNIWPYIVAILLLALLILVHELGHFLSARAVGIRVDEFAVGFGPKLCSFKGKVTEYSLRAIPLGGFCRYHGEDEDIDEADAFNKQPVWKRFFSVISGPLMNMIAAFVVLMLLLSVIGFPNSVPRVESVVENSAAMEAGMMAGDNIVSAGGTQIDTVSQLVGVIKNNPENPVNLVLENEGITRELTVTPRMQEDGSVAIGIYFATEQIYMSFAQAGKQAINTMGLLIQEMVTFLRNLVVKQEGVGDLSGPVGIVVTISDTVSNAAQNGIQDLLLLVVFISVNLGFMNMLPIPGLDGSRLIFLAIEAIRRKPFNRDREGLVHLIGLGALMVVFVLVTYKDIVRLFQ